MSEGVQKALSDRAVDVEKLKYCVKCDMDAQGMFLDTYLAFDGENLYAVSGYDRIAKNKKDFKNTFDFSAYSEYKMSELYEIYVERYRYSACIMGKTKENDTEKIITICRFSIGFSEKVEQFCKRFNAAVKGETLDDSMLEEMSGICPKCNRRYPDPNRKYCPFCIKRSSLFKRLIGMFKDFKGSAVAVLIMMILSAALSIIAPYFSTAMLYDDVLAVGGKFYGEILMAVLAMAIFTLVSSGLSTLYGVIFSIAIAKVTHTIRTKVFCAMQRLSLSFFTSKQTGSLMTRIDKDTGDLYGFFTFIVPQGITNIVKLVAMSVLMFVFSPVLALAVIGLILFVFVTEIIFVRGQRRFWRNHNWAGRAMRTVLNDAVNGHRVVKAFAREKQEKKRFFGKLDNIFGISVAEDSRYIKFDNLHAGIYMIGCSILTVIGFYLVIKGDIGIGHVMLLMSYFGLMWDPIFFFVYVGNEWSRCLDAASRIFEIIDSEPTVKEPLNPAKVDADGLKGDICLKNVSFEYEAGTQIIKDLSINIKQGKFFGIVGKTGAGKSTLINLITRMYDVTNGEITIDGIPIKNIAFEDLRRSIGVVSQDTYLFMGSIADNIRYARPEATMDEVVEAAKSANAHDFIMKLPDGYDTLIGSGGTTLSGGEKQRVSIARALIQKPNILIMDEATASMDTRTERKIQSAVEKLKSGRTIIAIAHRLSTLRDADTLCVIENGELKEIGDHDELIHKKGKYYELYKLQSEALRTIGVE